MKKVLIIGRCNHSLLRSLYKRLAEDQALDGKLSFDFLSLNGREESHGIYAQLIDGSRSALLGPILSKIPKIGTFLYFRRLRAMLVNISSQYSVIHFQFAFSFLHCLTEVLCKFNGVKVLTFWGSDVYRMSANDQQKNSAFYQSMDFFTFANPDMRKTFYHSTKIAPKKDLEIRFGLDLLDQNLRTPKIAPTADPISVYLGTNGSKGQQHLSIIDALRTVSSTVLDRLIFVLPFNYGVESPTYQQQVELEIKSLNVDFKIITDYYSGDDLIKFRKDCDILIQTQVSDAFSGAMQEHLFFGSVLITGSWLPYQLMKDQGVHYHQVDGFRELGTVLEYCVEHFEQEKLKSDQNHTGLYELSSWEANLQKWKRCYSVE